MDVTGFICDESDGLTKEITIKKEDIYNKLEVDELVPNILEEVFMENEELKKNLPNLCDFLLPSSTAYLHPENQNLSSIVVAVNDESVDIFECQNSDGSWDPCPEIEKYLGISIDLLKQQLLQAGLKSLGPKTEKKVEQMIITMLVLSFTVLEEFIQVISVLQMKFSFSFNEYDIKLILEKYFSDYFESMESLLSEEKLALSKAFLFCLDISKKYYWVCHSLHLGNNWCQVMLSLLQQKVQPEDIHDNMEIQEKYLLLSCGLDNWPRKR